MLRRLIARARAVFRETDDQPFIAEDRLNRTSADILDKVASPPECGPLMRELEATLKPWSEGRGPRLKLIVLPPCDRQGIVRTWAKDAGRQILEAPDRSALTAIGVPAPPDLDGDGDGPLAIPRLEHWFLRHRNGLSAVRALLAALKRSDRRCVIGCDSWAWAFLCKAVDAHMILPKGLMFHAFDAKRLRDRFAELSAHDDGEPLAFRLPGSGEDVLAMDDDGDPKSDYFERLAAASHGVPWVAWRM